MKTNVNYALVVLISLASLTGCTSKNDPVVVPVTTTVEVTVNDGHTWSATNTTLSVSTGATVNLYDTQAAVTSNTPKYSMVTDQTGKAKFTVNFLSQYYILVQNGTAKNLSNGLLIQGIFQSQADIQSSAFQTPAGTIGGLKFADLNGDGKIDNNDKTFADYVNVTQNANVTKSVIIY